MHADGFMKGYRAAAAGFWKLMRIPCGFQAAIAETRSQRPARKAVMLREVQRDVDIELDGGSLAHLCLYCWSGGLIRH